MDFREIHEDIKAFERLPESIGRELRDDLAAIISQHLNGKNWTQSKLAAAAGMKPAYLSRLMHSDQNWTVDVAGRLLFALGIRANLSVQQTSRVVTREYKTSTGVIIETRTQSGEAEIGRSTKTVRSSG